MLIEPKYKRVTWSQQFLDEDGKELVTHEFDAPPVHFAVGDHVEFSFCAYKGRVARVSHYFRELLELDELRHVILLTLEPRESDRTSDGK